MSDPLIGLILDDLAILTPADLCGGGRVSAEDLDALVTLGLISRKEAGTYPASCLRHVRRAARLKQGLDADWETVALIMDLLREIEGLKAQVRHLEASTLKRSAERDAESP